jgi:hypothetical protein
MERKILICFLVAFCLAFQSFGQRWRPKGADTTFPRSIIHSSELDTVRKSLAAGRNIELYHEVYQTTLLLPPRTIDPGEKIDRASFAKNSAFVALLGVKPVGNTTVALSLAEKNALVVNAITAMVEIDPYINPMSLDSPTRSSNGYALMTCLWASACRTQRW